MKSLENSMIWNWDRCLWMSLLQNLLHYYDMYRIYAMRRRKCSDSWAFFHCIWKRRLNLWTQEPWMKRSKKHECSISSPKLREKLGKIGHLKKGRKFSEITEIIDLETTRMLQRTHWVKKMGKFNQGLSGLVRSGIQKLLAYPILGNLKNPRYNVGAVEKRITSKIVLIEEEMRWQ